MKDIPAFPSNPYPNTKPASTGMTLRDYFASAAMPKLIELFSVGKLSPKEGRKVNEEFIAEQAYAFADAMLKERERKDVV